MRVNPALRMAVEQGGFITRRQLMTLGWTAGTIHRSLQRGDLRLVAAGVYQMAELGGELPLLRGALLSLPNATVSHGSAARLWEFPYVGNLPITVSVHHRTTHEFPGVVVRRTLDLLPQHRTQLSGVWVTTPERTLADLAADVHLERLDRITDGVLSSGIARIDTLVAVGEETGRRGRPGTVRYRAVLGRLGEGSVISATALERLGRSVLRKNGVEAPIPQFPIPWDTDRRFDDAYPDARLALEWDSRRWHAARQQMALDRSRDRECLIHDWALLRFTWHELKQNPQMVADQVRAMLEKRKAA